MIARLLDWLLGSRICDRCPARAYPGDIPRHDMDCTNPNRTTTPTRRTA